MIQVEGVGLYCLLVIDNDNICSDILIFLLIGDFDFLNISLGFVGSIDCVNLEVILDVLVGVDVNFSFGWFVFDG